MNEVIKTGISYRIMADLANSVWHKLSFRKVASDIILSSGSNLEKTCGAITGITDSLTSTSSTTCASSNAVKLLNDKITELQS